MDKYYWSHCMSMDEPQHLPVEKRGVFFINTTFSCRLEFCLHLLNQHLLLRRRLGFE